MLFVLLLVACGGNDDDTDSDKGDSDTTLPSACSDGSWGAFDSALDSTLVDTAFHVSADAESGGAGTGTDPFQTLDEAVTATRETGASKVVIVWPGTYTAALDLGTDLGDDGLRILGCGSEEVTVEGADNTQPVIKLKQVADSEVSGLTLTGGLRGLLAWDGTSIAVSDVAARENGQLGILIDGSSTTATLSNVKVSNPISDEVNPAYGLAIQGAMSVTATDIDISGAGSAGILIDGTTTTATFSGVVVTGTEVASDGRFGRGIQVQGQATASISDASLEGNHDAGLFSLKATYLTLTRVQASGTLPADLAGTEEEAADGITITDGDPSEDPAAPYYAVALEDVSVDGVDRAGVLLSGSGLGISLINVTVSGAGVDLGSGVLQQDGADAGVYELTGEDVLLFTPDTMAADVPAP